MTTWPQAQSLDFQKSKVDESVGPGIVNPQIQNLCPRFQCLLVHKARVDKSTSKIESKVGMSRDDARIRTESRSAHSRDYGCISSTSIRSEVPESMFEPICP